MPLTAGEALATALAARAGTGAMVGAARSRSWASATFAGARHRIEIRLPVEHGDGFVAGIEEADFALGRHLLADLSVVSHTIGDGEALIGIEALTIEES